MTYDEAASYLRGTINETFSRTEPVRLDRMRAFLAHLGDPQLRYATIHVAGTSGKGSVSTMLAAALTASGKRTGLHTKPHLSSMTERSRIDGRAIGEDDFAEIFGEIKPAIEATAADLGRPSYYETLLGLTFAYFARANVEIAVIEAGIGGTLDGTNLMAPLVSIITNVGLDHTELLGDTVEEIARDKAGIAKRGVPLVSGARGPARAEIELACAAAGAPFVAVDDVAAVRAKASERYGLSFDVATPAATYELELPILGAFQRGNAATAIAALELLPPPWRPQPAAVEQGLAHLVIPGRMEFYPGYPSVVFDIAHNPDKAASLAKALLEAFPERRFTIVAAISESKDAVAVLKPLFELPASFVFTSFDAAGRTAERPMRLATIAEVNGVSARAIADPIEALGVARRSTDGSNIVVVTGSTFVTGQLRDWWREHVVERARR